MRKELKIYIGSSRGAGPEEGAVLIFAHGIAEAKVLAWKMMRYDLVDDYIDVAVNRLWEKDWLFKDADQEKLKQGISHVVIDPTGCKRCELWGGTWINEQGICLDCEKEIKEQEVEQ